MIVRKIKPEELKRTKELFATAFEFTYDNKDSAMKVYEDTVSSPKSREDDTPLNKYAAFEDDDKTMMSCLSVNSYEMNFDGNLTKMAGIGGVSSLPQYRRRGGIRGKNGWSFHSSSPPSGQSLSQKPLSVPHPPAF